MNRLAGGYQKFADRVCSDQVLLCSKSHGWRRVGSEAFQISRVVFGRFGSGQPDPTRTARNDPTREHPWLFLPNDKTIKRTFSVHADFIRSVERYKVCGHGLFCETEKTKTISSQLNGGQANEMSAYRVRITKQKTSSKKLEKQNETIKKPV